MGSYIGLRIPLHTLHRLDWEISFVLAWALIYSAAAFIHLWKHKPQLDLGGQILRK